MSSFFNLHCHSQFSTLDGMARVEDIVARVARYKQPIASLTDHGVMSGTVKLYQASKKMGVLPMPGIEAYIMDPKYDESALENSGDARRFHMCISALTLKGYQGLVKLSTLSYTRPRFNRFPRLLIDDLVAFGREYGNDVVATTGCYFGLVQRTFWEDGIDATEGVIRQLRAIFPHLYVELHNHAIPDGYNEMGETQLRGMLLDMADQYSLPIIAGVDSHYLDQSNKAAHNLMKAMTGGMNEFPGDTYHVASTGWVEEKFEPEIWSRIEASCADIVNLHALEIPQLDVFKPHMPVMHESADEELRRICVGAMWESDISDENMPVYEARLDLELDVIKHIGVANYFLLVKQVTDYLKSQRIPIEARGSVNGSLVAFWLGITTVDPIIYGTVFERFLNYDRVNQMPDIDIDISDKHRHIALDYLNNLEINGVRYQTSQIVTYAQLGQSDDDEGDTGSAFNTYVSYIKRSYMDRAWANEKERAEKEGKKPVRKTADEKGMIAFNMSEDKNIKKLEDVRRIHPEDYEGLKQIIAMKSVFKSRGTHAGGILISSKDTSIEDYVPLLMIPKASGDGTVVTQYTMKDVEQFGLLKMDILGQTSLSVMSKCMELLGKDPVDFSWIPNDDEKVLDYVSSRHSHIGLFHLENYPKSVAMAELKPKSTADFVIHQAYSMPGAVDSGAKDIYLKRRRSKRSFKPDYEHPVLVKVFAETLGVLIYQEQVLDICRGIGMPAEELTSFFKVIKDSGAGAVERNRVILNKMKVRFEELATATGFTKREIDWAWNQMVAMGGYGFSKNHAAGYGIRSYRTAYLKFYYPLEYMTALLYCWAGVKTFHNKRAKIYKDDAYLKEARDKMGIRILPVRVNKSEAFASIDPDRKAIRKGYIFINGIGPALAPRIADAQPYTDVEDFCRRSKVSGGKDYLEAKAKGTEVTYKGVLKTLHNLDSLEELL